VDRLTGNHESAFAKMMNRLRVFLLWVKPNFNNLKNKEIVFGYHLLIDNPAFKIGITLIDKRRVDARDDRWREAKNSLNLSIVLPVLFPQSLWSKVFQSSKFAI
jgi:hypothetical protein